MVVIMVIIMVIIVMRQIAISVNIKSSCGDNSNDYNNWLCMNHYYYSPVAGRV